MHAREEPGKPGLQIQNKGFESGGTPRCGSAISFEIIPVFPLTGVDKELTASSNQLAQMHSMLKYSEATVSSKYGCPHEPMLQK